MGSSCHCQPWNPPPRSDALSTCPPERTPAIEQIMVRAAAAKVGLREMTDFFGNPNTTKYSDEVLPAIANERAITVRDLIYVSKVQCMSNFVHSNQVLSPLPWDPSLGSIGAVELELSSLDPLGKVPSKIIKGALIGFFNSSYASLPPMMSASPLDEQSNAKIVTVGIPPFYAENFLNWYPLDVGGSAPSFPFTPVDPIMSKISGDWSPLSPRTQRVVINMYKRDLQYPDLVFQPNPYEFDLGIFLSLYPQRQSGGTSGWSPEQQDVVARSLGTFGFWDDAYTVDEAAAALADVTFPHKFTRFQRPIMGSEGHWEDREDLQIRSEKFADGGVGFYLRKNHVNDHMLEIYLKLLTGASFNELTFLKSDRLGAFSSPVELRVFRNLVNIHLQEAYGLTLDELQNSVDPATAEGQQLLNILTTIQLGGDPWTSLVNTQIEPPIADIGEPRALEVSRDLKILLSLFRAKSVFAGGSRDQGRLVSPKMFDRVFNILVDPDKFLIDTTETDAAYLNDLINAGVVEEGANAGEYRVKPRNRSEGYYEASEFFVTLGPGSIIAPASPS